MHAGQRDKGKEWKSGKRSPSVYWVSSLPDSLELRGEFLGRRGTGNLTITIRGQGESNDTSFSTKLGDEG